MSGPATSTNVTANQAVVYRVDDQGNNVGAVVINVPSQGSGVVVDLIRTDTGKIAYGVQYNVDKVANTWFFFDTAAPTISDNTSTNLQSDQVSDPVNTGTTDKVVIQDQSGTANPTTL